MAYKPTQKNPNPQGKGLSPVLQDWQQFQPQINAKKSDERLFADYFTSLLILSADFRFKPVVGQHYYLYIKEQRWKLSLIEPERWGDIKPGECLGTCQLHADMTWSLQPRPGCFDIDAIQKGLKVFYKQVVDHLDSNESLQDKLPFYVAQLPFYQRMVAAGLARSIKDSVQNNNRLQAPSSEWLNSQPASNPLLPAKDADIEK